jgi:hypothetical protein
MLRFIGIVLAGAVNCIWAFFAGFTAVFTAKMAYYGVRDAIRQPK